MFDDGTSVSWGRTNGGRLVNARLLPRRGDGYWIPPRWADRGLNYGTDEMIRLLVYLGRRMSREYPGAELGVADISPERGGRSAWHGSHQSGLDVDLLFFEVDHRGRPVRSSAMLHYAEDGSVAVGDGPQSASAGVRYFDVERNWYLVRSVIENPIARVQYIFIFDPLRQMLLDHATAIGEPPDIVLEASYLLHQPGDSAPHDDHFHIRIFCANTDRMIGCRDRGNLRWTKKDRKYRDRPRTGGVPVAVADLLSRRMPAMFSLTSLPFRGGVVK